MVNYTFDIPDHYQIHRTFHVSVPKPCYDNGFNEGKPPMIIIEGEEGVFLYQILQHQPLYKHKGDSTVKYLIKWKGYGPAYNGWEPESEIRKRAPDMLSEYCDKDAAEQAVQATQPVTGSDTGLAPGAQPSPARGRGRGRGQGTDCGFLIPITRKGKQ